MGKRNLYSIYDGEIPVKENVYACEVAEFAGMPNMQVSKYSKNGMLLKNRYTILCVGEKQAEPTYERQKASSDLTLRWEEACRPFRNVRWVKQNGYDLASAWRMNKKRETKKSGN